MRSAKAQESRRQFTQRPPGLPAATPLGITCEFNPPPGCFMVQTLAEGALDGVQGTAHYAEEFQTVG